jgi:hypothetical protein
MSNPLDSSSTAIVEKPVMINSALRFLNNKATTLQIGAEFSKINYRF